MYSIYENKYQDILGLCEILVNSPFHVIFIQRHSHRISPLRANINLWASAKQMNTLKFCHICFH